VQETSWGIDGIEKLGVAKMAESGEEPSVSGKVDFKGIEHKPEHYLRSECSHGLRVYSPGETMVQLSCTLSPKDRRQEILHY
jgi:hypothetical protein